MRAGAAIKPLLAWALTLALSVLLPAHPLAHVSAPAHATHAGHHHADHDLLLDYVAGFTVEHHEGDGDPEHRHDGAAQCVVCSLAAAYGTNVSVDLCVAVAAVPPSRAPVLAHLPLSSGVDTPAVPRGPPTC